MPRQRFERLQVMLSAQELAVIDEFRFRYRLPSRAAAIRELLRRGIAAGGDLPKDSFRSIHFGVVDSSSARPRRPARK